MGSQCRRYGVSAGFEDKTGEDKRRGKSRGEKRVESSLECGTAGDEKEWEFAAGRGNWREAADY